MLPCQEHDCAWPATRRLATELARCQSRLRPRILLQRAHARDVVDGPHPATEPESDPASPQSFGPTTASPQPIGPAAALQ